MITFSSSCLAIFDFVGCCNVISWQLMTFIVISRWVWSALVGGCGLPLIFVSESWSICRRPSKINDYFVNTIMNTLVAHPNKETTP